ncbi:mitochondrial transcription factor 2 [Kluyveromyces marxianus]|uniref:Mitochondrial transcription factor 2 n=1 Tax=Kluyveromyces marxianus TaxID=4911 RepID=A0ABX6F2V8_KLUMA|nr:mitochondrial transcription factor 2 [Kluyveromyces marxianus]
MQSLARGNGRLWLNNAGKLSKTGLRFQSGGSSGSSGNHAGSGANEVLEEYRTIREAIGKAQERDQARSQPDKEAMNRLLNPAKLQKQIVFSDKTPEWTHSSLMKDVLGHGDGSTTVNGGSSEPGSELAGSGGRPHSSFDLSVDLPVGLSQRRVRLSPMERAILRVEEKEKLRVALDHALEPHLAHLKRTINSDKDLLDQFNLYLDQYLKADHKLEHTQSSRFVEQIQKRALAHPETLPQPYAVTLPAIVRYVFESGQFSLPADRCYLILKSIYDRCKSCQDLSLYLNVCNVDFYNLLVKYTWSEYRDVVMVKELIYEMDFNGIRGDITTTEVLESVCEEMRYVTDAIADEIEEEDLPVPESGLVSGAVVPEASKMAVLWCADNVAALKSLNKYLKTLKKSMMRAEA